MKKITIVLIAAICAVMFVAPAYADDKVTLSGSFRIRAWDTENTDFDKSGDNDAKSYFDQRLRIGTKINVADDVTLQLRADWAEGKWGQDFKGLITSPSEDTELGIDRAFVQIKKEMWGLTAGQQYLSLGLAEVLDAKATGFKFDLNFAPVVTSFIYAKVDEGTSLIDDNDLKADSEDQDVYALNVNYTCDMFNGNVYVAAKTDDTAAEDSPVMIGLQGTAKLGMVNLTSELDIATGDKKVAGNTVDYMGTQFYLGADSNVSDAVNIGAELVYALGADPDKAEEQLTDLCNDWTFTPMSMNTPFSADISAFPTAGPFDPTGDSAGVQGVTLHAKYSPMDVMSLGAKVGYFQPEEDKNTDVDDVTAFNVWAAYTLTTNTELAIAYLYSDPEVESGATDIDPEKILVSRLQISF
ncbi:MAG: hypothetical protein HQK72_15575 [Desulfamplus sp.]|nr:hypothetical protein [Desulfamplus sp.]